MSHIFLSYSGADRERVRPLVALLEQIAPVWWDQSIRHGDSWDEAIEDALEEASCVVAVWTQQSVESRWVKLEARHGLKHRILVPVRLDAVDAPLEFSDVEAALLEDWDGSAQHPEAEMLKESVAAVVAERARSEAMPTGDADAGQGAGAADSNRIRDAGDPRPPDPPPRPRMRMRKVRWIAAAAVLGAIVVHGIQVYPGKPISTDTASDTLIMMESNQIRGILVAETGTASVQTFLGGMGRVWDGRAYHYIVDQTGRTYYLMVAPRSGDTLVVGMVHVILPGSAADSAAHTGYTPAQMSALAALLTQLRRTHRLNPGDIQSIQGLHIDGRMAAVRSQVARLLGEWQLSGSQPAEAAIKIDTLRLEIIT